VRTAQPLTVHDNDPEWGKVVRLLPDRLPEPLDQGSKCRSGFMVSVRVAAGGESSVGEVGYGPCRWPQEIEPVRLLMHTLLRRELAAERKCGCG